MKRPRRRLALPAALLLLFLASLAGAQPQGPDVPAGPAAVVGRLVHPARPEATADVEVLLYALSADGSGGLRQGRSDAQGRFRFDGVSNDPDVVYLVGARAGEVPFGSRFTFAAGELEHRVEVTLSDPLADAARVAAGPVELRIERGCTHLRVSHRHALRNPGEQVVYVPKALRGTAPPIVEVVLPPEAEGFEAMLGGEGVERDGSRVRFWGPVYPGAQEVEFGYGLPLESKRLEVGLASGAPSLEVFAPSGVLTVAARTLSPAPDAVREGQRYAVRRAQDLAPGSALALDLALSAQPPAPLRTPRAELWLELDDAALDVNERLEVVVDAAEGAGESPGVPLLCLPLPAGALALRFSEETLAAGLRRDPSGDLAIHGPLPSGATPLALAYRLPASAAGAELTRRWDRALPLLSVLIADTGVVAETERLHRRRSVRSADRMYLHLEGFGIEPREKVALALRRTALGDGAGGWAATGFALLAGLAALGFLAAPLRGGRPAPPTSVPDDDPVVSEREHFARDLEDLDEDLETGKLSREDHAVMRVELRARAAERLLRPPAPPHPAAAACPACDAVPRAGDRFCARCGAKLDEARP